MSAAVQGDPRRPQEVHSFVREEIAEPRSLTDYYSVISLLSGVAALTLKWKLAAWISFLFCGASFANTKTGDNEVRQLSWTIMTATSAIVSCYAASYANTKAAAPTPSPTTPLT